uniref:Histone-lysine N-methyltransferase, H3 lysine-79 specific n=1 Tax=Odontella aurita TaxID=265563 RepID=A0A7S4M4R7_9STRA|mmetsp:Transcript_10766/g.31868  ORF Transcript_10766/g.31868 Transcript_10766/m.31868 type:complete len:729 (+) Transcript_10766:409-2595(+)
MKPADRRRCLTERAAEAAITEEVMKAARAAGVNISTGWGLSNGKKKGRGVGKQDEKEEAERRRRAEEIKAVTAEVRGAALSAVVDLSEDGDGDGCDVDDAVEAGSSSLHPPLSRPAAASEAVAVAPQPRPPGPKLTLKKRRSRPQKKKRVCPGGSSVAANPAPPVIVPSGLHRASSMETAASATTPDLSSSASSLASLQAKSPPPLPLRPRSIAGATAACAGERCAEVAAKRPPSAAVGGGVGSAILAIASPDCPENPLIVPGAPGAPSYVLCPRRPRSASDFSVEGEVGRDVIGLGRDMKRALANSMETYADETSTRQILAEAEYSLRKKARREGGVGSSVVEGSLEVAPKEMLPVASAAAVAVASAPPEDDSKPSLRPSLDASVASSAATFYTIGGTPKPKASRRVLPAAPFSTREFEGLWRTVEARQKVTTEQIESSSLFRGANNSDAKTAGLSAVQTRAQYGRTLFAGTKRIIDMTELKPSEIFLDIGHGAGNACLQAAFTVGCEARGVEVVPERCRIADIFREELSDRADEVAEEERGRKRSIGEVMLREGSLTDPAHREFMTAADVVLVNNSDDIFGVRSGDVEGRPTLDAHVGGILAMLKPGARMVAFHPLLCLGRGLSEENERRRRAKLDESLDASFFTVERRSIGRNAVSWSKTKEITVYLYRRVSQTGSADTGQALFLCSNKKCWGNSVGTAALDEETGLLVEECVYCGTKRSVKTRR